LLRRTMPGLMMQIAVVVDTAPVSRLVERVLSDAGVRVENAGERSTAMMRAATVLFREDWSPTVLLLDSDSLEERAIVEQQLEIGGYLRRGSGGHPNRLILAIPQVEAVLFADRAGLEKALAKKITDEEAFEARFRPKAVFYRLLGKQNATERAIAVIDRLSDDALRRMAEHPVIQEIRQFIDEVRHDSDGPARIRRAS
jgi:hypothetical protein